MTPTAKYLSEKTKINRLYSNQFIGDFSAQRVKHLLSNGSLNKLTALYKAMLTRDAHMTGEIHKRCLAVISTGFIIDCEDDKIRQFTQKYLTSIGFNSFLTDLLSAVPYGFSAFDLVWERKDGYFVPRPYFLEQRYFDSDKDGLFVTLENYSKLYIENEHKFLIHLHKTTSGSITDFALLKQLAWLFTLKNYVLAHYAKYTEILGVPPVIVQTDSGEPEKIVEQVLELRSGGAAYFPKDAVVTLLEGKGRDSDFMTFIKYADSVTSQTILGGNLTTNVDTGSKAAAAVHDTVRTEYLRHDTALIEETINNLLRTVVDMNFNTEKYPTVRFDVEEFVDEQTKVATLRTLQEMGFELSEEYIRKLFRIPKPAKGEKILSLNINTGDREANGRQETNSLKPTDEIDRQYISLAEAHIKPTEKEIVSQLTKTLKNASSYSEAFKALKQAYPDFEVKSLEKTFFNVTANTELYGFTDKEEE